MANASHQIPEDAKGGAASKEYFDYSEECMIVMIDPRIYEYAKAYKETGKITGKNKNVVLSTEIGNEVLSISAVDDRESGR